MHGRARNGPRKSDGVRSCISTSVTNNGAVPWGSLLDRLGELPAEIWLVPPVVLIGAIVAIGASLHRARLRRYRAIAARAGLAVKSGVVNPSQVYGVYAGRRLMMRTTMPRSSLTFFRKTWTRIFVDVRNPAFVALRLRRRDVIDRLLRLGNAPVGDAEFDRRFMILSRQPGYVMMIFGDRSLRERMLEANIQGVHLVSSSLEVFYGREERSPEHAMLLFDATVALADSIDRLR